MISCVHLAAYLAPMLPILIVMFMHVTEVRWHAAGDKPELLYPEARQELREMGFESTVEYVAEACRTVLRETGLLPHVNAGVMGKDELMALRTVSGSQGLMLETASTRLMQPGMPHFECPDKVRVLCLLPTCASLSTWSLQEPYPEGSLLKHGFSTGQ